MSEICHKMCTLVFRIVHGKRTIQGGWKSLFSYLWYIYSFPHMWLHSCNYVRESFGHHGEAKIGSRITLSNPNIVEEGKPCDCGDFNRISYHNTGRLYLHVVLLWTYSFKLSIVIQWLQDWQGLEALWWCPGDDWTFNIYDGTINKWGWVFHGTWWGKKMKLPIQSCSADRKGELSR